MKIDAIETGRCLAQRSRLQRNIAAQDTGPIRIILAKDSHILKQIYKFRYQIYVDEMHLSQIYADDVNRTIQDPLDDGGYNFAAMRGNKVVGVLRVNFPRTSDICFYEDFLDLESVGHFHPSNTSICTRLMVASARRGTSLALRLSKASYAFGLANRVRFNFIDCNTSLVPFFERLGYVFHRLAEHPEHGIGSVMRLDLLDRVRLIQLRSPFLSILNSWTKCTSSPGFRTQAPIFNDRRAVA